MESNKSLDIPYRIIAALLCDVQTCHGVVINDRSLRLDLKKVHRRVHLEGMSFLTKTLPRLGRAFDRALCEDTPLNSAKLGFKPQHGSQLPIFMGPLFNRVLDQGGKPLPDPCTTSVRAIRAILFAFSKYKLPYSDECEQNVLSEFERTEEEIKIHHEGFLQDWGKLACGTTSNPGRRCQNPTPNGEVVRKARRLLGNLFAFFDPKDIYPRHGPGAVSTKEQLWDKYLWTNVSANITPLYPYDEYFCSSGGQVCDTYKQFAAITEESKSAKVILVPKDSRGPRLISCESVDHQWIQQGLGRAISKHVEAHPLTRENVRFTDQEPNMSAALVGSALGQYATLDLKEASDRITLGLVRLLFPEHLVCHLESCRSSSTVLPDGRIQPLNKFAPMGSALCFPILALTVWAILTVTEPDTDARKSIYVYGDDVIVKTASAENAITQLEAFGLKLNRAKCCTNGFFRESCGMDAFRGSSVTPVKLKTVWETSPSPKIYVAWIAYANSFYDRFYYRTYDLIVSLLHHTYGDIPDDSMELSVPSLREVTASNRPKRRRVHKGLQKTQWHVWDVKAVSINKEIDGWAMLLRYFAEHANANNQVSIEPWRWWDVVIYNRPAFSVRSYTRRDTSMLVKRWR